jgi:hypothetical protein
MFRGRRRLIGRELNLRIALISLARAADSIHILYTSAGKTYNWYGGLRVSKEI